MLDRRLALDPGLVLSLPLRQLDGASFMSRDAYGAVCSNTGGLWRFSGMLFSGAEFVSIPDADRFSFGDGSNDSPFSVSAWVNMDDASSFTIISKGIYNTDAEWCFLTEVDGRVQLYIFDESVANTYERVLYNTILTSYEGQWIHLVETYDGRGGTSANDGMNLYLNGEILNIIKADAGTYVSMENLDKDVWIGRYHNTYTRGKIDSVLIYRGLLLYIKQRMLYERGRRIYR